MTAQLAEIVAKAARDPAAYRDLRLVYQRGHDLSGITRFEMRAGGSCTLNATNPYGQTTASFEGELAADQRAAILTAVEETRLLAVPSSTRAIGDDELPVIVEVGYDNLHHRLLIWAGDARQNAAFRDFEQALWGVLTHLSGGELGPGPAASA